MSVSEQQGFRRIPFRYLRTGTREQSRAPVDTIAGSIDASPSGSRGQSESFQITLEPSPTGMKSGEFELSPVPAPFCSGVKLSTKMEQCVGRLGVAEPCPPIRFVGTDGFEEVEVVNPASTVCYD